MNRFIVSVMAACALLWVSVCLAGGDDAQSQKDHAALQGEWKIVSAESNGEPPPPGLLDKTRVAFSGDKLTLAGNQGTFALDAIKTPRQIDITGKTVRQVGIYKLDGDKLTLCVGLADDRPKEFKTRTGTNYTMFVLSRAAAQPAQVKSSFTNSLGMKFVRIEPGVFQMGGEITAKEVRQRFGADKNDYFSGEHPRHTVRLTRPYMLGIYDVTRGEFASFVQETKYKTTAEQRGTAWGWGRDGWKERAGLNWRNPGIDQTDEHPVVQISHDDAMAFCRWLSQKEGKTYRLPTEAEWEYACRAGTKTIFFWGDQIEDGKRFANMQDEAADSWLDRNYGKTFICHVKWNDGFADTSPVGSFQANPWGLYDMLGNVSQWCSDGYAPYREADQTDPRSTSNLQVLRGGSWSRSPANCRPACRGAGPPDSRGDDVGFRLALDVR